jgi:hypothetical protein
MDWSYVESVFADQIEYTVASRKEILDALAYLEQHLGLTRISEIKTTISNSSALNRIIELSNCLQTANQISGGNKLSRKLSTCYTSDDCQEAISIALAARPLITGGAKVQYEPNLEGTTKHPDLVATWGTVRVVFEVALPTLSHHDEIEDKQLEEVKSQCENLLKSGFLNIYFTEPEISPDSLNNVLSAISDVSADPTHAYVKTISNTAYIAYEPLPNESRGQPSTKSSDDEDFSPAPINDPQYHEVKAKLKISTPMTCQFFQKGTLSQSGFLRAELVIRIHRPATDPRAFGKIEQEYEQLSPNIPGVIVLGLSRTSVTLDLDQWTRDIHSFLAPGLCPKMTAVWWRSGTPAFGANWNQCLIQNPHAARRLPEFVANQLIPNGVPINITRPVM